MKLRMIDDPEMTGISLGLNTHAMAEVVVGFDDNEDGTHNGADSCFFRDVEVYLTKTNTWKCLSDAFRDGDVIPDDYNSRFREPENEEERKRGYY